jgi:hypothetical protein
MTETNFKYLMDAIGLFYNKKYSFSYNQNTPNTPSIVNQYLAGLDEDLRLFSEALSFFDKNKEKYEENSLSDFYDINDFLEKTNIAKTKLSKKEQERVFKSGSKKIYEDENVFVIRPLTHESSCFYGRGTKWCTSSTSSSLHFDRYTSKGNLYYIYLKKYENDNRFYRVALQTFFDSNFDSSIYWDSLDEPMNEKESYLFKMFLPKKALEGIKQDFDVGTNLIPRIYSIIKSEIRNNESGQRQELLKHIRKGSKTIDSIYLVMEPFVDYTFDFAENPNEPDMIHLSSKIKLQSLNYGHLQELELFILIAGYGKHNEYNIDYSFDGDFSENSKLIPEGLDLFHNIAIDARLTYQRREGILSRISLDIALECKNNYHNLYPQDNGLDTWIDGFYKIPKQYGYGYTFEKGGSFTRNVISYLKKLPKDAVVTRIKLLYDLGLLKDKSNPRQARGHYASAFSAMKTAGILSNKQHISRGPKFDDYAQKFGI